MGLIKELPAPSVEKTGWPWSEEATPTYPEIVTRASWPTISIITPSLNQSEYIEETIRSVLLQNYPKLEYIILDGGSTDKSIEIIKKYSQWLTFWESCKDGGQSDALNRGINIASGELVTWLNSDDILMAGCLNEWVHAVNKAPNSVAWVGICDFVDLNDNLVRRVAPTVGDTDFFLNFGIGSPIGQAACLFRRSFFNQVGQLNPDLYFTMDIDLWAKLGGIGDFTVINKVLAQAKIHDNMKTYQDFAARTVEHIIIAWDLNKKNIATKYITTYTDIFAREHMLNMPVQKLFILLLTWLYRRTLKTFIKKLMN